MIDRNVYMKTGRSKPEVWWTQRSGSSKTALVAVELLGEGKSSVERPSGWVWWSCAWCRARPNKAPAAYLCVGVRYDGDGDGVDDIRVIGVGLRIELTLSDVKVCLKTVA